jgi:hypothetical protein
MAGLVGEVFYVVSKNVQQFSFGPDELRDMTAIFFWAGWLGFWGGFILYTKREKKRRAFLQRMQKAREDLPPAEDAGTAGPAEPQV